MSRHLYRCPLRWADMDQLGHVNNVTYVDYLQEARVDMLRVHAPMQGGEELAEGTVVVRHEVDYVAPLVFRQEPVNIDTWVTEVRAASFTLAYEIYDEDAEGNRVVYLAARSVLAPYVFTDERPRRITDEEKVVLDRLRDDAVGPKLRQGRLSRDSGGARRHRYECHVRFSDVDLYRHVNNVKYFEYIQEARIDFMFAPERPEGAPPLSLVVGAIDVEYSRPIVLRADPYPIDSWVEGIGSSSFVISSEISDGTDVLARARAVMVSFDPATSRSTPIPDWVRERLTSYAAEPASLPT